MELPSLETPEGSPNASPTRSKSKHMDYDPSVDRQVQQLKTEGKAALARQDFRGARDLLSDAIRLRPEAHKLYRLRSVAHACMQDYDSSLEDAEMVITLSPKSTDGYYHKGFALYHKKEFSDAAHAFKLGLNLNPADHVLQQAFWDAVTLLSQHRVCLPMRYQQNSLIDHTEKKPKKQIVRRSSSHEDEDTGPSRSLGGTPVPPADDAE